MSVCHCRTSNWESLKLQLRVKDNVQLLCHVLQISIVIWLVTILSLQKPLIGELPRFLPFSPDCCLEFLLFFFFCRKIKGFSALEIIHDVHVESIVVHSWEHTKSFFIMISGSFMGIKVWSMKSICAGWFSY